MKPVNMIVKHDPENGSWGDCTRCCIASILELPAQAVPHFTQYGEEPPDEHGVLPWERRLRGWLAERGYNIFHMQINGPEGEFAPGCLPFHYVRGGKTRRGTLHDTVYFDNQLVHDPRSGDAVGILTDEYPQFFMLIVKA